MRKVPVKHVAEKIWCRLFDNLYDRSQFDWWWDAIEDATKAEVRACMIRIIETGIRNHLGRME